jgi:3-deoxy-7-phosphoheptulonate synthase
MANDIERALTFMQAIGADPDEFHRVDFHSSHEALVLEYEHAMTRIDSRTQAPYDVSAHFLWIGERTRQLDGAHVELLRHVRNPIGVKLGPTTSPDDALALAGRLNPDNEPGRLTFITRFGASRIRDGLPQLIEKVSASGVEVAWVCDPMHGNTFEASSGYKTRRFDDVIDEVQGFFDVHRALGTWPGGLHVELTGDDVTECVGGGELLDEAGLSDRYESVCDPRLNRVQSLELSFLVAKMLRQA